MTAHPKPERPLRGTAECRAYLADVHELPCCICGAMPVEAHHCAHGRYSQTKTSDFDTIPLCAKHHKFRTERGETWAQLYGFDTEYIPATRKAVEKLRRQRL